MQITRQQGMIITETPFRMSFFGGGTDFPEYFKYIVSAYEKESGNKLSYKRLVSYASLSDFVDIISNYRKGGVYRVKAEESVAVYRKQMRDAGI